MRLSKRYLRKCLSHIMECSDKRIMLAGKQLKDYCADRKHRRAVDALESMGALKSIYYDEDGDCPEREAIYPLSQAALIECNLGISIRERWVSFFLGLLSGALLALFTAWITGTLTL